MHYLLSLILITTIAAPPAWAQRSRNRTKIVKKDNTLRRVRNARPKRIRQPRHHRSTPAKASRKRRSKIVKSGNTLRRVRKAPPTHVRKQRKQRKQRRKRNLHRRRKRNKVVVRYAPPRPTIVVHQAPPPPPQRVVVQTVHHNPPRYAAYKARRTYRASDGVRYTAKRPKRPIPRLGFGITAGAIGYEDHLRGRDLGFLGRFRLNQSGHLWAEAEYQKTSITSCGGCDMGLRRIGGAALLDLAPSSPFSINLSLGGGYADGLNGNGEGYGEVGLGLVGRLYLGPTRIDGVVELRTGGVSETFDDGSKEVIGHVRTRAGVMVHF